MFSPWERDKPRPLPRFFSPRKIFLFSENFFQKPIDKSEKMR